MQKTLKVNHGECQLPTVIQSSTVSSSVQSTLGKVGAQEYFTVYVAYIQYNKHFAMGTGSIQINGISDNPIFSDTDSILDVLRELSEITCEWSKLGLALKLKDSTLSRIETDKKTVDECKREMVRSWLQQKDGCKPSWEALVDALEDRFVQRCDVAKQIKQNYKI